MMSQEEENEIKALLQNEETHLNLKDVIPYNYRDSLTCKNPAYFLRRKKAIPKPMKKLNPTKRLKLKYEIPLFRVVLSKWVCVS